MDRMPDKPSFIPSELDAQYAAVRGDAAGKRGHREAPGDGRRGRNLAVGIAVGVASGAVIGVFFGNLIVGIAIGMVIGVALGAVMDR